MHIGRAVTGHGETTASSLAAASQHIYHTHVLLTPKASVTQLSTALHFSRRSVACVLDGQNERMDTVSMCCFMGWMVGTVTHSGGFV